ncbi:hypothetical protein PIROE2DRAFT_6230 [Piromyces sp. E2]|nr:hypothetical protein PIROE2DRAFT_6230 [Piromyces sp. E2]|eukprot:OUM66506.1 hypothetical protein PIROE2DRAFT_6230 [Piromyces sp. E2]
MNSAFFKCIFDNGLNFAPLNNNKNLSSLQIYSFNKSLKSIPESIIYTCLTCVAFADNECTTFENDLKENEVYVDECYTNDNGEITEM